MTKATLAQHIADDFVAHLDEWYSLSETFDNELDRQIHRWYADAPKVFPKRPYFSPSAANACPRELYYKVKRAPRDKFGRQPHTGRWTEIGTFIGDMIQRTVLAMERNLGKKTDKASRFRFERNKDGTPMFEDFAKKNRRISHKGHTFYLFGTCDGIMRYTSEDGEIIRVGLEVKSKQTTPAKTSEFSMREPQATHVKQCVSYAEMYDVDYYVILYVNTAHKSWYMSEEDYRKTPDIRAFGIHISQEDKDEVFDQFASVLDSVDRGKPLPLDLDKWSFNNFKQAIAEDMPSEEFSRIKDYARRVAHSSLPAFKKANIARAVEQLEELRKEGLRKEAVT